MPEYRITWEIDLTAETPQAAAELSRTIQLDSNSLATEFDVDDLDNPENSRVVDLDPEHNGNNRP